MQLQDFADLLIYFGPLENGFLPQRPHPALPGPGTSAGIYGSGAVESAPTGRASR